MMCGLLLKFREHFPRIFFPGKSIHDFKLRHLDIHGVVIFAEEDLDIILQNSRSTLNDQENIAQSHVLNFRSRGEQCDCRRKMLAKHESRRVISPRGGPIFLHT
jgi:hypothetical protein